MSSIPASPPAPAASDDHGARRKPSSFLGRLGAVILVALLSAGLWVGWFAWDTEYQYDAGTGQMTGPYEIWQGVGAFGIGIVVAGVAHRLLHPVIAMLVMSASFTVAWSVTASGDETGLWLVGAFLVAFGSAVGAVVLLSIAGGLDSFLRRRTGAVAT